VCFFCANIAVIVWCRGCCIVLMHVSGCVGLPSCIMQRLSCWAGALCCVLQSLFLKLQVLTL
jgi:hypothetical protein